MTSKESTTGTAVHIETADPSFFISDHHVGSLPRLFVRLIETGVESNTIPWHDWMPAHAAADRRIQPSAFQCACTTLIRLKTFLFHAEYAAEDADFEVDGVFMATLVCMPSFVRVDDSNCFAIIVLFFW